MKLRRIVALVLVLVALVLPGPAPVMTPPPADAQGIGRVPQRDRRRNQEAEHRHPGVHGGGGRRRGRQRQAARRPWRAPTSPSPASSAWWPPPEPSRPTTPRRFAARGPTSPPSAPTPACTDCWPLRGDRAEVEMRLYDLTNPDHRLIASKKFEQPTASVRRLAHKVADEIVMQFTGDRGIADTKIAFVSGPRGAKEIVIADYDGAGADAGDAQRLDQPVAGVESRRALAGLHLVQAGLSRPLPGVSVRAAARADAGGLRRDQQLARVQSRTAAAWP